MFDNQFQCLKKKTSQLHCMCARMRIKTPVCQVFCFAQKSCSNLTRKFWHNPNIVCYDIYVQMLLLTLSLPTCRVCARAHPPAMLKPRQRHRKAFRPVTSCNVPLSQNHLMAKVTTVIFSLYLKVVLQLFSESRGSAFLLLALAYYLLFWCSLPVV